MIHVYSNIDSIIFPKYLVSDLLESGSKSQGKIYFPRNDRFFCNDTTIPQTIHRVSNGYSVMIFVQASYRVSNFPMRINIAG